MPAWMVLEKETLKFPELLPLFSSSCFSFCNICALLVLILPQGLHVTLGVMDSQCTTSYNLLHQWWTTPSMVLCISPSFGLILQWVLLVELFLPITIPAFCHVHACLLSWVLDIHD